MNLMIWRRTVMALSCMIVRNSQRRSCLPLYQPDLYRVECIIEVNYIIHETSLLCGLFSSSKIGSCSHVPGCHARR